MIQVENAFYFQFLYFWNSCVSEEKDLVDNCYTILLLQLVSLFYIILQFRIKYYYYYYNQTTSDASLKMAVCLDVYIMSFLTDFKKLGGSLFHCMYFFYVNS